MSSKLRVKTKHIEISEVASMKEADEVVRRFEEYGLTVTGVVLGIRDCQFFKLTVLDPFNLNAKELQMVACGIDPEDEDGEQEGS